MEEEHHLLTLELREEVLMEKLGLVVEGALLQELKAEVTPYFEEEEVVV